MLPILGLIQENRELGLLLAVLVGFSFGFVLERAGFGRAEKLAAQFYLHDMTVFKVMFSGIITAMLGLAALSGLGLADLKVISESAVSFTYLWPQLVGGLLLGAGFIISGYCPGTSAVSMASGNVDGLFTFGGVIIGSVIYGEIFPLVQSFHESGNQGHLFLYNLLGMPPQVLAVVVAGLALAMFLGAERVERIFSRRRNGGAEPGAELSPPRPRRLAFGVVGAFSVAALATLALPGAPGAAGPALPRSISQEQLARRLMDEPWTLRVLDLREQALCARARIPGAECVPWREVSKLGLAYSTGARDLVLVYHGDLQRVPAAAGKYPGNVRVLAGGWQGWRAFALTRPEPPGLGATAAQQEAYRFRVGLNSAMTGRKPPPPPAGIQQAAPRAKKKGGGCG